MKIKKAVVFKWLILLVIVVFSAITLFTLKNTDQFYVQTEQLLVDPFFIQGQKTWERTGSEELVDFRGKQLNLVNQLSTSQTVSQNVAVKTPVSVRLTFEGSSRDVVASEKSWAGASSSVVFRNKAGERIGSKTTTSMVGTNAMNVYADRLVLRDTIGSIDISFRLLASSGTFSVKNPVLSLLVEFPAYKKLKALIGGIWLVVFAGLAFIGLRVLNVQQIVSLLVVGAITLGGALMPESLMSVINEKLAASIPDFVLSATKNVLSNVFGINKLSGSGAEVSKLGHFFAFTLIGLIVGWYWRRVGLLFGIACVLVFALLSEILQLLVEGRTPSSADLLIDISGALLGISIGVLGIIVHNIYKAPRQTVS